MAEEDDDLIDPLQEPRGTVEGETAAEGLVGDALISPPSDNLDIDFVDEFDADDFDEEFDDDFEEEVEGEYDLEDDQYGEDFDKEFGHLTDPSRDAPKKAPEAKKPEKKKK